MLPIRIILHPTDFSPSADYAFRLACALARDYGARLFVLHVGMHPVITLIEGVVPPESEWYQEDMSARLHNLQSEDPRTQVEPRLMIGGDPAAEILRVAQETKADLIVMGTHGRTGLGRLLMGSVAEQIVRRAPCTTLTVRTSLQESQPSEAPISEMAGSVAEGSAP